MSDLISEVSDSLCLLTINRTSKHNAFDDKLLMQMQDAFEQALNNPEVRVIILKANGTHFSAGADLAWMQRMTHYTIEENTTDAMVLAQLMHTIYQSSKPTIAMIQGCAYGGGAGLAAACDIAIAADNARFCFSEAKLGLIPAVISPFVIHAIGARSAQALFMSAEVFDAQKALALHLVHHCIAQDRLLEFTLNYAMQIANNAPEAVADCKKLTRYIINKPIDTEIAHYTAALIAKKRVSEEGQKGLNAFLNKKTPNWN